MSKIISKIGFSELKTCFESDAVRQMAKKKDVEAAGMAVMFDIGGIIIGNLPKCETEIYNFLADLTGLTVNQIQEASLADFAEMIVELVRKDEFKDFIGVVSKLFK
jgi:hypothetical protein